MAKKGSDPISLSGPYCWRVAPLPAESRFDLIIIGGGINGAAIAREAALSGLGVLLLEREDLCAGTSAASTRLIHGGLRYLEHAEFGLVRESLLERERLLALAPHLVEPLEIFLPLTRSSRRSRWMIRLGLGLYDLLSWGKSVPRHRMLNADELSAAIPGLVRAGLRGGAAYFDAQVRYPERLVLENVLDAVKAGASVVTHTAARELIVAAGRIEGVAWESEGRRGVARAAVVVNAAGPWVDSVLGPLSTRKLIGGTRGSHLVVEAFADAPRAAIYAEAGSDGRPFFIIPWNDLYLIGTTDERYDGDPGAASMQRSEYDYLVAETRRLFPAATDLPARVRYSYAGIRPLPHTRAVRTGAITRRHLIKPQPGVAGLYSIVGGKLTTHRALAVDCLRALRRELPRRPVSPTARRPLPGALDADARDDLLAELGARFGEQTAHRLWRTYGGLSRDLIADRHQADLGQRIGPGAELIVGELVRAVAEEGAKTLIDVLLRRTMVGLGADLGRHQAPLAADWLVRLGIWDKTKAAEEIAAYSNRLRRYTVPA
jgi:glycerol-3-phosphate dehydrogenase